MAKRTTTKKPQGFQPSPQQAAVFTFATDGMGNVFIEAVAGAGKTTTLIETCKLFKGLGAAFVAFNKSIVEELRLKVAALNLDVNVDTFHAYGFKAWRKVAPGVRVDARAKWDDLLEYVPPALHGFVKKAVSLAKNRALGLYGRIEDKAEWLAIADHFGLFEDLDETFSDDLAIDYAIKTLKASNNMARQLIDFDDMIYCPVLFGARLWQYDRVLVDEAQDTNDARRALVRKLVKPNGRIFFVGDTHQAIYGFTGADADSVDRIVKDFSCKRLPLTVTYRCPKAVVAAAQQYVSHIQAHESAPDGLVREFTEEQFTGSFDKLLPTDAILCRKTKPLIELAYTLIRKNIACHVEGRDIGAGLLALLNKWKSVKTVDGYLSKLESWEEKQTEKLRAKGNDIAADAIADKAATMRVLCEKQRTLADVAARINSLFEDTEPGKKPRNLTLSTVHKSKGREWPNVYVLGFKQFMPSQMAKRDWELEQETNLIYVAFTRAQETLTLADWH